MAKAAKAGKGRPSKFSQSLAARILELATKGKTEVEIAHSLGISPTTLANWKGKHPDFLEALKKAKDVADDLMEATLFQRGMGYSYSAVKFFFDSKSGKVVSQAYVEKLPPDTTAIIFWLKNRRPDRWRDVNKHELTGADGGPIKTQQVTKAEIEKAAREAREDVPPASENY